MSETGVRIDWEMTLAEWEQLRGVLLQHLDVGYIQALASAGKLGAVPVTQCPACLQQFSAPGHVLPDHSRSGIQCPGSGVEIGASQ